MVRKMMLTVAVAMLAAPAFASAQSSTVMATATVGQSAVVTGAGNLAFGVLTASDNVIAADGGAVTRTLTYNHNVNVTFAGVPTALTSAGVADLPISLMCAARLGGVWSTPVACSPTPIPLDVGASMTQAILGFGGTILGSDVANAAAGTYTGSFDIVIAAR